MSDNRVQNMVIKMTNHGLSSRFEVLAVLMLKVQLQCDCRFCVTVYLSSHALLAGGTKWPDIWRKMQKAF